MHTYAEPGLSGHVCRGGGIYGSQKRLREAGATCPASRVLGSTVQQALGGQGLGLASTLHAPIQTSERISCSVRSSSSRTTRGSKTTCKATRDNQHCQDGNCASLITSGRRNHNVIDQQRHSSAGNSHTFIAAMRYSVPRLSPSA